MKPIKPDPILLDPIIHAMILAIYAKYSDHPHACEIHRLALAELERVK